MNPRDLEGKQLLIAEQIINESKKAGVNPDFALSLMFNQSQFSPSLFGDSPEEIAQNIGVAIETIKDLRETLGDDPAKIAAGFYAGGSGAEYSGSGRMEDLSDDALIAMEGFIKSFGGNIPSATIGSVSGFDNQPDADQTGNLNANQDQNKGKILETITPEDVEAERQMGRLYGAGAGAVLSGTRMLRDAVRGGLPTQPAQPPAPPSPTGSMRTGPAGALPSGQQIQATTPGQRWAQAVTGVVRPGTESVVEAASDYRRAMPSGKVSKPTAQRYGINAPLDIGRIAAQNAPPPPARGLESVTQMFQRMAQTPLGQAAGATVRGAGRYALPPLALASGVGEALGGIREAQKQSPDYIDVGLSGLGALGAGLSLFPATAPVGLPMAIGAPLIREARKTEPAPFQKDFEPTDPMEWFYSEPAR
jgi:hypothetical protein